MHEHPSIRLELARERHADLLTQAKLERHRTSHDATAMRARPALAARDLVRAFADAAARVRVRRRALVRRPDLRSAA